MMNLKDYYHSKMKLIEAVDSSPRVKLRYKLEKYCKVPLYETPDESSKIYYSFKPDDQIEVLWEYDVPESPSVKYIKILSEGAVYFPDWKSSKIFSWLLNSTKEI